MAIKLPSRPRARALGAMARDGGPVAEGGRLMSFPNHGHGTAAVHGAGGREWGVHVCCLAYISYVFEGAIHVLSTTRQTSFTGRYGIRLCKLFFPRLSPFPPCACLVFHNLKWRGNTLLTVLEAYLVAGRHSVACVVYFLSMSSQPKPTVILKWL